MMSYQNMVAMMSWQQRPAETYGIVRRELYKEIMAVENNRYMY